MRIMMTSALALFALASLTAAVEAAPCPPGMVRVCLPQPQNDRPPNTTPPPCKCESQSGSGSWSGGGKAEIQKKNVPSAKQNKSPGPND